MAKKDAHEDVGKEPSGMGAWPLIALIVIVLAAGAYYLAQQPPATTEPPPIGTGQADAAGLVYAAYEKGSALSDYDLSYDVDENGARSVYVLKKRGNVQYASVEALFGKLEGYFEGNNETDVICLNYSGDYQCAVTGNDSDAQGVANSLKVLFPNSATYEAQLDQVRKLNAAGALRFDSAVASEKVGGFDTQKVAYSLDYRGLTVDQLLSVGVRPDDPQILSVADQRVTLWIDRKSGLVVKSLATFKQNLAAYQYQTMYSRLVTSNVGQIASLAGTEDASAFVIAYLEAEQDFGAKQQCLALPESESASCLKAYAAQGKRWEICSLIKDSREFESCSIIVAQATRNHVICEKLALFADDCYIAVAGQTGNFELCRKLANQSLLSDCTAAATEGTRVKEENDQRLLETYGAGNCTADAGCGIFGNAKQYCYPKSGTPEIVNETSPLFSCLKDVPCGCVNERCAWKKNDTYYSCLNKAEEELTHQFMAALSSNSTAANQTGNSSG